MSRSRAAKTAGIAGAVVGVAAAGLATAFAVERVLVRRSVNKPGDPYVDEPFGDQPYDEERTVTAADGTELHVEIVDPRAEEPRGWTGRPGRGRKEKPTIVFVHGFALDMGTFYFQRKALAERGDHRLVFYDQPGHGRSSRLQSGAYDIAALGRSLAAVLDATVPDGHIILVGHSMGGMTIMAFAEQFPEWFGNRVTGVVLMSTSAGLFDKATLGLTNVVARASAPFFPLWDRAAKLGGGTIDRARVASSDLAWLLTRRYGFGEARPSPSLVTFVESMNSRTSVETLTKYLNTLYRHSRLPALSALRGVPVLVVVGDRDYLTPVTHSEQIIRELPQAELLKIENSGHVVMLEKADEVNAALIPFLEKIS
ncbi:alpha/beta hydrolase [Actinoplanes sp. SE50]|uniref:alpha/beta fold hydrolase n=1 Tax=unclassified Actinoplanes TaxID=2626549 RepID=UPI00023ED55E|nr:MULTISPECIES: alpha/beta hydrolase [unclassified Actinoplanes]AEV81742.1 alpha/beta hydrolase fold protein [Actinoplanes sp. SE50/110]ATO80143.1 alpha/beta hydrolase [Actinoplanes sp. SE50]SLL97547.1 alpha/beta hydrolase [Actinoplanes sp. SE50/110]